MRPLTIKQTFYWAIINLMLVLSYDYKDFRESGNVTNIDKWLTGFDILLTICAAILVYLQFRINRKAKEP